MDTTPPDPVTPAQRASRRVAGLRTFPGPANEFWPACLEALAGLAGGADAAILALPGDPAATRWRCAWEWRIQGAPDERLAVLRNSLWLVATAREHPEGVALVPLGGVERALAGPGWLAAVVLDAGEAGPAVVLLALPTAERSVVEEGLQRVMLAADLPRSFSERRQLAQAQQDVETLASALDLVALLDVESSFPAAAMTLCNELAARHHCQRVSLSWRAGPYLRLRAISHMEKFERRMSIVALLEAAMEEAADQNTEIVLPMAADGTLLTRDHELYLAEQRPGNLCTLPLRAAPAAGAAAKEPEVIGALTCERAEPGFTEVELRHLRLTADQAARRLAALDEQDAWWGKRALRAARRRVAGWVGPEHTLAKAGAIVGAAVLLWSVAWPLSHDVEASFALRGAETAIVSAPFDGFLAESLVEKGDQVAAGTILAQLDETELVLELAAAQADATRYEAEVQQARSERKLADMQIAQARHDQARARVDMLRHRLEQSKVRSPVVGVVVEGDLRERRGAPLKQGDALFRVARLERMYAEVLVPEADVRFVQPQARAELMFASHPGRRFPVQVERVEPLAQARPEGNVFLVRCILPEDGETWWRPGMSGVAQIAAGRRPAIWQATRRTLDYLRLRWW